MLTKLKEKYTYVLEAFLSVCQADRPKKGRQWLELDIDNASYTDGKKIHIGLSTIPWEGPFKDEEDEEFQRVMLAQYLLEHEDQHNRSTRDKDFTTAQNRGLCVLLEEISKLRNDSFVFRNPTDYERYIKELNANGINLELSTAKEIIHYIVNSMEDGRIERIRSYIRPGFNQRMVYVRAALWLNDDQIDDYSNTLSDKETLDVILANILYLSTTRVYQKGFFQKFVNTEAFDAVNKLIPHIKKAIMSGSCRGLVKETEAIIKILAPYIFNVIKSDELDNVAQGVKNMMAKNGMSGESNSSYTAKASTEETTEDGDDIGDPMGCSDLNDSSTNDESDNMAKQISNQGDADFDNKTSSNATDDKPKSSDISEEQDKNQTKDSESSRISDNDNGNDDSSDKSSLPTEGFSNGSRGHAKGLDADDLDNSLKEVLEAMKKAAENMQGDFKAIKRQASRNSAKSMKNIVHEDLPPFIPSDQKLARHFKELKRAYKLDNTMPFALQNRSKKFAEDVDELFANQEQPLVRCQKNGSIDVANIYKLGINSIDCFSKELEIPEFDGAAYILVDNSGSMGYGHDSNRYHACNGVSVIEAGFSKHMPLKVVAFDDNGCVYHEIIKDWEENLECSGAYNFMLKGRRGGGTPTGESIMIATEELLNKNCDSKMLIIMTDGEPNNNALCRDAIENARAKGIEVVTIFYDETANIIASLEEEGRHKEAEAYKNIAKKENTMRLNVFGKNSIFCAPEETEKELAALLHTFVFG